MFIFCSKYFDLTLSVVFRIVNIDACDNKIFFPASLISFQLIKFRFTCLTNSIIQSPKLTVVKKANFN